MFDRIINRFKFRAIGVVIAILLIGLVLVGTFVFEKIAMSKGVTDFNEMKSEDFKKGRFVQGEVQELTMGFAEEYEQQRGSTKQTTTSIYYLMPLYAYFDSEDSGKSDEYKYIVVRFSKSVDIEKANRLIDEINDYYESGEEPISLPTFTLEGKVSNLKSEVEKLLYDTLIENGLGKNKEECSKYVCPYYIECKEGADITNLCIGIVLTILGACGTILIILRHAGRRTEY